VEYAEASFVHLVPVVSLSPLPSPPSLSLSHSGDGEVHLIAQGFADSPAFV